MADNRKKDVDAILENITAGVPKEAWSPYLYEAYNRFNLAITMLQQHDYKVSIVAKAMKERYDYDLSQAYQDIGKAQQMFGAMQINDRSFWQMAIYDKIQATRRRAQEKGDTATLAKCDANEIKLFGLDREKVEKVDLSKFRQSVFELHLHVAGSDGARTIDLGSPEVIDSKTLKSLPDALNNNLIFDDFNKILNLGKQETDTE